VAVTDAVSEEKSVPQGAGEPCNFVIVKFFKSTIINVIIIKY